LINGQRFQTDEYLTYLTYTMHMFKSLPFEARKLQATESRLQAIYDAAKLGLKGDKLALAAGMLPSEYRQLTQLDPVAEMAALKGAADAEREMSTVVYAAALEGDAKMALEMLKHKHDWVAKQSVQIDVVQQISITQALEQAQSRMLTAREVEDVEDVSQQARPQLTVESNAKANIRR
jgi:hypothetical protein